MIIQGVCNEVEFSEDGLAPYSTSIEARRLAKRLIDAADRADGLLPNGVYRVTFRKYPDEHVVNYRRIVNGKVLSIYGDSCDLDDYIIHERIGDIP